MIRIIGTRRFFYHFIRYFLLLTSAAIFSASLAWANSPSELVYEYSVPTIYAGARAGYVYKYHACADIAIECDRDDVGYGLFAGYKPWTQFALELSANDLGHAVGDYSVIVLDGEIKTVDLSIIYSHNIYKNINAFGKLGIAYWEGEVTGWEKELSDSGMRPLFGVGLQFPLGDHIDGRFEYQYMDQLGNHWMGYTDAHFLNFSLVWQFSSSRKTLTKSRQQPFIPENIPSALSFVKPTSIRFPLRVPEKTIHQYVESTLSDFITKS